MPISGSTTKRPPQYVLLISGKMLVPVSACTEWTTYSVSFKCFFYFVHGLFAGGGVSGRVALLYVVDRLRTMSRCRSSDRARYTLLFEGLARHRVLCPPENVVECTFNSTQASVDRTLTYASDTDARCSFQPGAYSCGVDVLPCSLERLRLFSSSMTSASPLLI